MNPLFTDRSFPLLYPRSGFEGEPIRGIVDGKWYPLGEFVVGSLIVPLSHELHTRTALRVEVVRPGTEVADVAASLMLDRACEWLEVKPVPVMSFDEFRMRVMCGGQQRSAACADIAARLATGSGHDRRVTAAPVNLRPDVTAIVVAVVVTIVAIAVIVAVMVEVVRLARKRNGGG